MNQDVNFQLPSTVQAVELDILSQKGIELSVKRDDQIHPVVSGNKWRKLKLNVEKCQKEQYDGILTFGGAYSNHIRATAAAGKIFGIKTIGIIRGDELSADVNETLRQAEADGMQLVFTKREEYDLRGEKYYAEELRRRHGNVLVVPEGGANYYGVLGAVDIVSELEEQYDYIFLACGTGTTAAGILLGSSDTTVVGVPVLKNGRFLSVEIERLLFECGLTPSDIKEVLIDLDLRTDYHFGGYAKHEPELIDFINDFYNQTRIPLDQVYTGKMMYGLLDMVKQGEIEPGSKVLAIHTGGLQGLSSIKDEIQFYDSLFFDQTQR